MNVASIMSIISLLTSPSMAEASLYFGNQDKILKLFINEEFEKRLELMTFINEKQNETYRHISIYPDSNHERGLKCSYIPRTKYPIANYSSMTLKLFHKDDFDKLYSATE